MKKLFAFCFVISSAFSLDCYAQTDVDVDYFPGYRQAICVVPQYAVISGIRIDYERKISSRNQWLVFSPQYYSNSNGYSGYHDMTGTGLNVFYKQYLWQADRKNGHDHSRSKLYFSAGPTFQYFSLLSIEEVPEEFTENGITYIQFHSEEVPTRIYKLGLNVDFGYQVTLNRFILDFYLGIGMRHALDENGEKMDDLNDDWLDYGYSGALMDGGVRLGFLLK